MSDLSPLLSLPLIQPAQAQKHVTHNSAIDRLDMLVQLVVEAFDATNPPGAALEGQIWALGAAPVGVWAGQAQTLASWRDGAWVFITPAAGWRAWGRGAAQLRVFAAGAWGPLLSAGDLQNLPGVGINTSADATNRLALSAPASLFSHQGAGHQVKVNKAAAGDTASLLFQSGWSGRAEIGLAGSDDLSVKVSPDGTLFNTALTVAASSGAVTAPAGLRLASGSAALPGLAFDGDPDTGLLRPGANQIGLATAGVQRALLSASALQLDVPLTGTAVTQSITDITAGRLLTTGAGPAQAFRRGNSLGTVSQTAGVPTGALIERGSNANGDYVRYADGTQICTNTAFGTFIPNAALGPLFIAANETWTYPAAFASVPVVAGSAVGSSRIATFGTATTTNVGVQCLAMTTQTTASAVRAQAIGRWF